MIPPIMAKAIGPQNTSRAIGIMPRLAAAAVSRIGRMRCMVASTTASHGASPSARKASIWVTRITVLRMMMPISASTPRMATKPSGWLVEQQRRDHADQAERRHAHHQEQLLEALQLQHQDGRHQEQHQRHDVGDRPLALAAFLDRAADRDRIAGRQLGGELRDGGLQLLDHGRPAAGRSRTLACRVMVGWRSRRQTSGCSSWYSHGGDRRQRNRLAVAAGDLQGLEGFDAPRARHRRRGATTLIEVDAVVHLRHRRAADHVVQHGGDVLRAARRAGARGSGRRRCAAPCRARSSRRRCRRHWGWTP